MSQTFVAVLMGSDSDLPVMESTFDVLRRLGVPMPGGVLDGVDALLSTVQMPGGVPVASVAVGKAGAKNAGYLAAQILATADAALGERLVAERAEAAEAVLAKDAKLQAKLG